MVVFPNAKINLGLKITSKRPDNYHELSSVFYPVPLYDILEITESTSFSIHFSGLPISGNPESNLVVRAYKLLHQDFHLPPIAIHLHKTIPMGAGLGGGSADASFMLNALNKHFALDLGEDNLLNYAKKLGADCPFFIKNQPALATGIGEKLTSIPPILKGCHIAIISPNIHVSTKEAFELLDIKHRKNNHLIEAIKRNPSQWQDAISNDFEQPLFKKHPKLQRIKQQCLDAGAFYASMTGSGSSVYGLFETPPQPSKQYTFCGVL